MLMALALAAGPCVLAYPFAVYALPFMIGVETVRWAYSSGSGLIGAGVVGLVAGAAAYSLLIVLFIMVRTPILHLAVALVFAAPAAIAGYALVHGITREAMPWNLAHDLLPVWRDRHRSCRRWRDWLATSIKTNDPTLCRAFSTRLALPSLIGVDVGVLRNSDDLHA